MGSFRCGAGFRPAGWIVDNYQPINLAAKPAKAATLTRSWSYPRRRL